MNSQPTGTFYRALAQWPVSDVRWDIANDIRSSTARPGESAAVRIERAILGAQRVFEDSAERLSVLGIVTD